MKQAPVLSDQDMKRMLRRCGNGGLTLLAPEIVEAIPAGTQPAGLTRAKAMQPFGLAWTRQKALFS
jgi:hypothetical protein